MSLSSLNQRKRPASSLGDDAPQGPEVSPDQPAREESSAGGRSIEQFPRLDMKHLDEDYDHFDPSVDMDGTLAVVVGRPSFKKTPNLSIYSTENGSWELTQRITLRVGHKPESVAMSGDLIAMGVTDVSRKRAIHLYKHDAVKTKKWKRFLDDVSGPETGYENFAGSVSLDGHVLVTVAKPKDRGWRAKKECPFFVYRIDGEGLVRELCETRYQDRWGNKDDWGNCLAGVRGNRFVTYDRLGESIYIYEYHQLEEGKVWKCVERIQLEDIPYVDDEDYYSDDDDEDNLSEEKMSYDKGIQQVVLQEDGSLIVGFSLASPLSRWGDLDAQYRFGGVYHYSQSPDGHYTLKQRVNLFDDSIWKANVEDIAADGFNMIVSVAQRDVDVKAYRLKVLGTRRFSVRYSLVGGVWNKETLLPFYAPNIHLSANRCIAQCRNNASYYTLDEEGEI